MAMIATPPMPFPAPSVRGFSRPTTLSSWGTPTTPNVQRTRDVEENYVPEPGRLHRFGKITLKCIKNTCAAIVSLPFVALAAAGIVVGAVLFGIPYMLYQGVKAFCGGILACISYMC